MNEFLKKPYEISIWKDKLVDDETESGEEPSSYFDEEMVAIIGSDGMTSPNRAYSPTLTKNVNGETTLTFSMLHRYFDNDLGEEVFNPLTKYMVNERKVKLHYDGKWYDFIVKNCEESSDSNTFQYTCTDLWVNELSKTGYNIELAQELANNQGTIFELAQEVVKSTDWEIVTNTAPIPPEEPLYSDVIRQWVQEPLYKGKVSTPVTANEAIDVLNNGSTFPIAKGETVYFFYSEIINKETKNVTIMRAIDNSTHKWVFDDNNVVKGPNYRMAEITYQSDSNCPSFIDSGTFSENLEFQGYRLNYAPVSKYDPVTEKYIDLYQAEYGSGDDVTYKDIYHYRESEYITSDILFNAITNGSNFDIYGKDVTGWSPYGGSAAINNKINIITHPKLAQPLPNDLTLEQVEDLDPCLQIIYAGTGLEYAVFNNGIFNNRTLINGFTKGEEYAFRVKYGTGPDQPNVPAIGLVVAEYELDKYNNEDETTYYKIKPEKIYFDLQVVEDNESPSGYNYVIENNEITGGYFEDNYARYVKEMSWGKDILPPSRQYVYYEQDSNIPYVWANELGKYVQKSSNDNPQPPYVNAWCAHGPCLMPLSANDMAEKNIGFFLVVSRLNPRDNDKPIEEKEGWKIRQAEFFKYRTDANNKILLLGTAPEATENTVHYYYIPDESITDKDHVETYSDLSVLADELGINVSKITQVYNKDCEKITSIEAKESNYFNIIQDLCEKFQCWAKFHVEHEANGKIKLDNNNNPIKKISFHEYVGKENFAGFKYGINLSSIQRTLDSNEFVSKLIVAQNDNEYVDGGVLTIRNADANSLGESYILNFSYYLNQGLIDAADFYKTYGKFQSDMKEKNILINQKNKEYRDIHAAMTRIEGMLNVYRETLYVAPVYKQEAEIDIKHITGAASVKAYLNSETRTPEGDDAIVKYLAKILVSDNVESGYSGFTEELQSEYDELQHRADGYPEYTVTVSLGDNQTIVSCSDFIHYLNVDITGTVGGTSVTKSYRLDSVNKIYHDSEFIIDDNTTATIAFTYTSGEGSEIENLYDIYDSNKDEPITGDGPLNKSTSTLYYLIPKESVQQETNLKAEIEKLQEEKNDIEKEFFKKYGRFIQEGTWTSDDYVDNNLYYLDALQVSNTSAQPKLTYSINVVEVSEIEGLSNYLFDVGDKTYMEDTEFFGWIVNGPYKTPVREEVIVSEVAWNLDSPEENSITVQNYKTQFEDLFQRIGAAVQSVEYKEGAYNRAASILDSSGFINSNLLSASLNNISGGRYGISAIGSVYTDTDGIIVMDVLKTTNQMKLSANGIMVSNDAGVSWRTIVSPDGIDISYLKAGIIDVNELNIMDGENTSFRWDKNGISAYQFGSETGDERGFVYSASTDTSIDPDKLYFVADGSGYTEVNPAALGWYVYDAEIGDYVPTTDTRIEDDTTYYVEEGEEDES